LNSGYYVIHTWAVSHKGPVYLSMFKPLSILIAAVSTFIFLGESLYLGRYTTKLLLLMILNSLCKCHFSILLYMFEYSVMGGILISIGFYMVLWGKAKEDKVDIIGAIESSPSHNAPLLDNFKS